MTRTVLSARSSSASSSPSGNATPTSGSSPSTLAFRAGSEEGSGSDNVRSITRGAFEPSQTPTSEPIASVERSPSPAFTFTAGWSSSGATTPKSSTFGRSSTPSISISLPPPVTPATTSHALPSDARGESLTRGLQDLELSSRQSSGEPRVALDLREIGAAIDALTTDTNSNNAPLNNGALISSPRGPSRRRSTPRQGPVTHKVEDEEPPSDEFHRPAFQRRLNDTRKLLGDLTDVLSSSSVHLEPDSTMKTLHERATKLSCFQPLSTRTVGFVGDSGVGKSSLLNSLLDSRGLARTTNNGAACTCVVTEYHYHADDEFVIEVEKFNTEELHEQLAELLGCYRNFHQHGESLDEEARKDLEARANIAADTFRAMFRGFLQDDDWLLEESQDVIVDQFHDWMTSASGLQSPSRQVVTSLEQCSLLLMQLTSEVPDAQMHATWPYIRKIKVFLKAHILSKGLILVDLPGLRDLNSARRNITERYIRNCHEIFAVCNIGRATTDVGVKSVFDLARDARLRHIGIVCTKSDDIDPEEIKDDWGKEPGRKIRKLLKSLRSIERELKETDEELETFHDLPNMGPETHQELLELLEDRRNIEKQRNAEDYELKKYAIEMRNAYVVRRLQETYQGHTTAETLHIFCVSNTMYWERRMAEKSVAEPFLSLSGIVAIRKHCTAMVSSSQLRTSSSFLDNDVPTLLSEIELWVQSGSGSSSAEQKEAVRRVLYTFEEQLHKVH
ncbi:hypothetical protein INS49_005810 [Diaporthe citri]|uniref:uncharacterized protein n=1 Tax=Diaporthe citri TaxID=83186 RepID=UPI001C809602|nr:uncharacterized protein INS49_005810 [Diaporthe citri]KAG6364212.1 hypothetical protein INS49_005810 [Diaporthe citri]